MLLEPQKLGSPVKGNIFWQLALRFEWTCWTADQEIKYFVLVMFAIINVSNTVGII